jgi:hypothetical protein
MMASERFTTTLKGNEAWADRCSIVSIVLAIGLMVLDRRDLVASAG